MRNLIARVFKYFFAVSPKDNLIWIVTQSIVAFILIRSFVFDIQSIQAPSSIIQNVAKFDKILIWKFGYNINNYSIPYFGYDMPKFNLPFLVKYKTNDIILFFHNNKYDYARILAPGNSLFQIKKDKIIINQIEYANNYNLVKTKKLIVPKKCYLCLIKNGEQYSLEIIKPDKIIGLCSVILLPIAPEINSWYDILYHFPHIIRWKDLLNYVKSY